MTRRLFHFSTSPFSRRARLALAHKGLDVQLCDARENPTYLEEARRLSPFKTVPVLVEPDGMVVGDSGMIAHYLDRAYPEATPLWPVDKSDAHAVFEVATLVDAAANIVVDLGTRYFPLRHDPNWLHVKAEMMTRIDRPFAALAQRVTALGRPTIARSGWSAGDIWLYSAVAWLEGIPGRVATSPVAAQIATLGVTLPAELSTWADPHRARADVRALDA